MLIERKYPLITDDKTIISLIEDMASRKNAPKIPKPKLFASKQVKDLYSEAQTKSDKEYINGLWVRLLQRVKTLYPELINQPYIINPHVSNIGLLRGNSDYYFILTVSIDTDLFGKI